MPNVEEAASLAEIEDEDELIIPYNSGLYEIICDKTAMRLVGWLHQALEVMEQGMPPESFSFVLDGEPDLDLSTDFFNTRVQRTIAWMKSHAECVARGLFPHRGYETYPFPATKYLHAMELLLSGTSLFRSNFDLGQSLDFEQLIQQHQEPVLSIWQQEASYRHQSDLFETVGSRLDLRKLRLEFFEQQKQSDYLDSSLNWNKREKKRLRRVRRRLATAFNTANNLAGTKVEDSIEDNSYYLNSINL